MFEREVNPENITSAKIAVGLPSYNEADSIDYPAKQAGKGLKKYYGDKSSVIINVDNHSTDGTENVFLGTETEVPKIYITTPPKTPGKGYNFENLFRKILEMDTEVLICLDADLLSITPEWIKYFAEPVLNGYDFVAPIYSRHKYDGTITNNICYPIIYGIFGKNIRQPIGGDFAISRKLAEHLICQPWHRTTEEYGIDIFMSMNAVAGDFKLCNTGLGAKVHKPSAPKLGPMFIQVVSTAFLTVVRNFDKWKNVREIEELETFGLQKLDPPQELNMDRSAIEKQAMDSFKECRSTLEEILSSDLYNDYKKMFENKKIDISAEQWVETVFDMIAVFDNFEERFKLVESLKGLYFGRALSFMNKTWDWTTAEAEKEILGQANLFYKNRDYLIKKLSDQ